MPPSSKALNFSPFSRTDVDQSVAARFEQIVARYPDRPAVCSARGTVTYDAFNRMANRIARRIIQPLPAQDPSRIAIFLEKDAPYLASIMGVLKAGHAYVPLDPAFPSSRNQHIVRDSGTTLILTNAANRDAAAAFAGSQAALLQVDELPADIPDGNLELSIPPDALAYIIYTSGSTGQPKGVMQINRNVLHGCMRRTNLQHVAPDDRMTLFYSPSVMGAVYCIFGSLLNGAALYPYDIREDGLAHLAEWLRDRRITIYHSVASVFRNFASAFGGRVEFPDIRLVIFGGERVLVSDVELVRKLFPPHAFLFTGLGSTETGTVRHLIITLDTTFTGKVVPIGFPVEDMEIVLVGDDGRPVPAGEVGEITVRSRYNAIGYWNQPEATRRAFVPDPLDPSYTSYHTGDMGCLMPGNLLEHRGRKDFQVKIRGFRVEISEVETSLLDYPGVDEAVVVAREIDSEHQLVAYLVQKGDRPLALRPLRDFLRSRLPYYMIPTVFVGLDAIPRTPNNKVDRKALPAPTEANQILDDEIVAPSSATEVKLARIWQELLRKPVVGVNQNFFDLGGHSLMATQLVSRILNQFRVNIPMRAIFDSENLGDLARHVDAAAPVGSGQDDVPLVPVSRQERIPLSFAQRRMWLIDQFFPGSAAYNISNTVRLKGPVDPGALERALNEVVRRHEILRTTFPSDEQGPRQDIHPPANLPVRSFDLRELPAAEREARARFLVEEYVRRPFDLQKDQLLSAALLRINDAEFIFILVFSHIIYDNIWSSGIFFRELGSLYEAFVRGSTPSLPALPLQFGDYAHWQQKVARKEALQEHAAYWKRHLANLPPPLLVPADFPRPRIPTYRGAQVSFHVPPELKAALADIARRNSATTFMLLLAAWQLLLHRYTQQEDITVGTPTGRRYRVETEGMIGLFINTLVLRTDFSGDPDFRELLHRVRQTTIDAFTHDELQFEDLLAELRPERDVGVTPLFQHLFIHRNASQSPWTIPGLDLEPVEVHPGGAKFDLTLSVLEDEQHLKGTIEYRTDLFTENTARRMAENFKALLASIANAANEPVSGLTILAETERQQVLNEWNHTSAPFPQELCAHELFEHQSAARAGETAVVCRGKATTYGELNSRANQLALHLRNLGVGPGVLVGLCVERSTDLVVGLLGILKAGGAYVPLDPGFPAERLSYMIEDSQAPVLLTESGVAGRFATTAARKVLLDTEWTEIARNGTANPTRSTSPTDLAYVIYTSGSTGRPKGVQLTQQALVNFLVSMAREPGITESDVLHAVTTISFDIAALEIFLPLTTGARLVMAGRETSLDPALLVSSLTETGATIMQATPVTWRMLLDHGWSGKPRLKILCGGEAMGADLAARLLKVSDEAWNLYGPTETTIWSSVSRILEPDDALTLGKPIANTEFQVLSPALAPQPLGVPGELHIGGIGLARGYFNRPELTAEKFIAHPFVSGERLYKTGDLVRRRPDGAIEFLGRIDNQVKLRGFRIELGEIESCLKDAARVNHVVVIAREDQPGDKRLVAYYTTTDGQPVDRSVFGAQVKDRLPEYMIPSAYVFLKEFPLTPNKKVDRKLLPKPEGYADESRRTYEEPVGEVEVRLARLFASVLNIPRVGRNDDFFELGGHSILAVTLFHRIASEFGARFGLATLFKAATVRTLSELIMDAAAGTASWSSLVPIRVSEGKPRFFCVHGAGGNILLYHDLAKHLANSVSFYGLQSQGLDGHSEPLRNVEAMARRYVEEVREIQPQGPYHLGGYCLGGTVAYEMARLLVEQGQTVATLALLDTYNFARRRKSSVASKLAQKVLFHLGNLRQVPLRDWRAYLTVKLRIARDGELSILMNSVTGGRDKAGDRDGADSLKDVQLINQNAAMQFRPQPYSGKLTLFAPRANYSYYDAPEMGWSGLVTGGIETVTLPMNPHAMLVEPFVRTLAAALAAKITTPADTTVPQEMAASGSA